MSKMESYKGKTQSASCAVPEEKTIAVQDPTHPPLFNKEEDRKAFQRNIASLCNIFKYRNDIRSNFGEYGGKVLEEAFNIMKTHMESADAGEWKTATGEEKSRVKEAVSILWQIVMDKPITDIVKDMSMEMSVLTYNWNGIFGNRPDINELARTVERLITMNYTILDTIEMAKRLRERSEKLLGVAPPAFELSNHYLETLDQELDKREKKQ